MGRAGVQGAIQQVTGGRFAQGFINSALASAAGEVTRTLDAHISQMRGLSQGEASSLRLLSRAAGSALRVVGRGDPAAGFASDFLGGLLQDGLAGHQAGAQDAAGGVAASGSAAPTPSSSVTVGSGDTLERIARAHYGSQWRAGMALMVADNSLGANQWGSPVIRAGQSLQLPSIAGMGTDQLAGLGRIGGQIVANNARGLDVRAQVLAQRQAQQAAQVAQAAQAAQATRPAASANPASGMSPEEAYALYMASGGRSGSYARALGEDYRTTWHQNEGVGNGTAPAPKPSWGQRANAESASWNRIIDRLDETAVADGGGPLTAAAAFVRAPARSFLGLLQGAVGTATLADPTVRAELSAGLGRLMEDPSALSRMATNYWDNHSAGEIAADLYAHGAAALMGGAAGNTARGTLNQVPGLGADVGALLTRNSKSNARSIDALRSPSNLMGVEPASQELLTAIGGKRHLVIAKPGSDELRMLDYFGAEASAGGVGHTSILLRQNPSKAAALEEFLHGTQARLGIIDRLGSSGLGSAETHVKDFMIRHQRILGLSDADIKILKILKEMGL